jgi:serine/threonine protein kinase
MEDRYKIKQRIGQGGMGTIFRATDRRTSRDVALKIIHPHLVEEAEFLERFVSETRLATALEHPNIVPVYDVGQIEQGPYIAMMLVPGESLYERLQKSGPLPEKQAIEVISQVAAALDYAHTRGVIHRDVKPHNILIDTRTGHAYLSDFGIAKALESETNMTKTGSVMGALRYMAPEQFEDTPLDARVDVYALACVLFEALSCQLPYDASSDASLIRQKLMGKPRTLSSLNPETNQLLSAVIDKALTRDPKSRFSRAGDLAIAAQAAVGNDVQPLDDVADEANTLPIALSPAPTVAAPTVTLESSAGSRSRQFRRVGVAAIGLVAASVLAFGIYQAVGKPGSSSEGSQRPFAQQESESGRQETSPNPAPTPVTSAEASSEVKFVTVTRKMFRGRAPKDWTPGDIDKPNSTRLTNTWINPDDPSVYVLVDTLIRSFETDPLDNAREVRRSKRRTPGYKELSLDRTRLGGRPAAEWLFDVPKEGRKVDFFLGDCNVDVAVLGVAPPGKFENYRPIFRKVASSVRPRCQTMPPNSPVTTDGFGPIKIDMTPEEVEFAGGIDLDATGAITGECQYLTSDNLEDVYFMFVGSRLSRIDISNTTATTLSGIRVGDPSSKVASTYGDQIAVEPGFYDPEHATTMTFVPEDPGDTHRVVFETRDGYVTSLRVGSLPAVHWVEGCA